MTIASTNALLESLSRLHLLRPGQLEQLRRYQQSSASDPRALARQLVTCGWLTPYQINQVFRGRGQDLLLGGYVVLEEIGEGGMGQVYKARHRTLDRIVALKVLRRDLGGNTEVTRRFHREIRAIANLTHPNIVQAFDADQAGGLHFLAMEFVPGIDLGRLVQQDGFMQVARACEVIRQAALGLDYAHSHGLVHRDIKPSNLLLAQAHGGPSAGLLKILDLGMARLKELANPQAAAGLNFAVGYRSGTPLTGTGNIIGTPDFMSPEQARNSHLVDGRADLYSLGCTLYTVLTGRMPFPGGTAMDKLFRHQEEQPTPVEQIRPEVPPSVSAIIRKFMAKRPEDRFQTGAEAANALMAALTRPSSTTPGHPTSQRQHTTMVEGPTAKKITQAVSRPASPKRGQESKPVLPGASPRVAAPVDEPSGRRLLLWVLAVSLAAMGLMAGLSALAFLILGGGQGRP